MIQDCISALRNFRRNPLLTAAVIMCVAIGIGGATAVFSVVDGVLLRKLPYPNAERLVVLRTVHAYNQAGQGRLSEAELRDWQTLARSFEAIAGYRWMPIDLVDSDHSERLQGLWVTPEYFPLVGIQASAGSVFRPGDPPGLILGRGVWQRRFGLAASIVGQSIRVGICCPQQPQDIRLPVTGAIGQDITSLPTLPGVRDRGHGLNDTVDYWWPLFIKNAKRPGFRNVEAIAKLKPGVTVHQAQSEMDAIARRLEENFPDTNRGWTVRVVPIADDLLSSVRPVLIVVMAAAAFVLLIACANVAVLLTFHAVRRVHEIAVRAALGASAGRLMRRHIAESLVLTLCGGAAGLLLAEAARRVLVSLAPAGLPRVAEISLNGRVFGFALGSILLCGLLTGLVPALRVLKFDLESTLRAENSRNATSHVRARTYEPLLALQAALTVTLVIGSGLMFKSLNRLLNVAPGFDTSNVITTTLSLPNAKHAWSYNSRFIERVLDRVRETKGIEAAGAIRGIPMNEVRFDEGFWRWDKPIADRSRALPGTIRVVSEGYFSAMRIPIVSGRDFLRQDGIGEVGKTRIVMINREMAQRLWPGENPIGQKITWSERALNTSEGAEVIGIVGDARYTSLDRAPIPEAYFLEGLFPQDEFTLVVRTATQPLTAVDSIRAAIHDVERDVFVGQFQSMDDVVETSAAERGFVVMLLSVFSGVGVLLAIAGTAGITAYSLSLRVREIGIRVAMGARPRDVIALISRQGVLPALAGIALGLVLALGLTRFLGAMLFNVDPYDRVVFVSAVLGFTAISVLTAALAARRACRLDASSIMK